MSSAVQHGDEQNIEGSTQKGSAIGGDHEGADAIQEGSSGAGITGNPPSPEASKRAPGSDDQRRDDDHKGQDSGDDGSSEGSPTEEPQDGRRRLGGDLTSGRGPLGTIRAPRVKVKTSSRRGGQRKGRRLAAGPEEHNPFLRKDRV